MNNEERQRKIDAFWAYYAPTQGKLSAETLAWLQEDDCLSPQYVTQAAR